MPYTPSSPPHLVSRKSFSLWSETRIHLTNISNIRPRPPKHNHTKGHAFWWETEILLLQMSSIMKSRSIKHNQANGHAFSLETDMFLFQMCSIMKLGWLNHYFSCNRFAHSACHEKIKKSTENTTPLKEKLICLKNIQKHFLADLRFGHVGTAKSADRLMILVCGHQYKMVLFSITQIL